MITIHQSDLDVLRKYYDYEPSQAVVDALVEDLAYILGIRSGLDIDIIQDYDDPMYYRLYAGCSAVDVYIENSSIQVDFDLSFQLSTLAPSTIQRDNLQITH
ncbi:MAG: hypothetical protein LUG89_04680 [Methanosphaera sp.]|nr:hypothetical protein [Methanosphaera sp.]